MQTFTNETTTIARRNDVHPEEKIGDVHQDNDHIPEIEKSKHLLIEQIQGQDTRDSVFVSQSGMTEFSHCEIAQGGLGKQARICIPADT